MTPTSFSSYKDRLEALGPAVRTFLRSDAGQAYLALLGEYQKDLAVEAMDAPVEGVSADYYRGQRAAIAAMVAHLGALALRGPVPNVAESGVARQFLGFSDSPPA